MNIFIGDIGNTITKICLIDLNTFKVKNIIYLNSKNIFSHIYLKKKLKKISKSKDFHKVSLFSSVVPKYFKFLKIFFRKSYKINLKEIKDKNINKIIKINIKNTKQLGSDRIANAVGAFKKYKTNCIVLDFGTATTFDVITKNGIYNGGVIAPGINLSIKSLYSSADQIPRFSLYKKVNVVGNVWDITETINSDKVRLAGGSLFCSRDTCHGTQKDRELYVDKETGNIHIGFSVLTQ